MITTKGLERLLQWAKYEAANDFELYEMADMVNATEEVTENHVAIFAGMIESGDSAKDYIAALKRNTRKEEDDNNHELQN